MSKFSEPRVRIWQAICDLQAANRAASRQVLADMTDLPLSVVDDHIKRLRADGKLRLVVNGVVEPTHSTEGDRPIAMVIGATAADPVTLEIGDVVLKLTVREARNVAVAMAGFMIHFRG